MESTYGDRNHETAEDVETQLERIIKETAEAGGGIVIPIFAIERAQEIIYYLNRLLFAGRIPEMPVFLDSPMAADVNEIFRDHRDCFDKEALDMLSAGRSLFKFPVAQGASQPGGIAGGQRLQGPVHHHVHLGHVYGGPHQAPSGAAHRPAGNDRAVRRLSGPRHVGPANSRRQPRGPHPRPFAFGPRPGRATARHLRPRRPRRADEMARLLSKRRRATFSSPTAKKTSRSASPSTSAKRCTSTPPCRNISRWWS